MKHSEIFENFIKIAEENGLMESDKAIAKLDKTRRHDYLSADDIEKLYNIKPDVPEDMKYERNIIEDAHPNSVVVSPSYDKINGLVENQNERQNIMLNIVNKPVNGQLTGHKYAHNELALNLIRLANDLDNKNNHELLNLADVCLNQIGAKSLKKQAAGPLMMPAVVVATVATMIAALWIQQQMKFTNEGFERNYQKLIAELDDLIEAGSKPLIVGYEYRPEFITEMQEFKSKLGQLYFAVTKNMEIINELEKPRDVPALIEAAKSSDGEHANEAYNSLREELRKITPFITKVFDNFKSEEYKNKQIVDKGILSNLVDRTQFLHGGKGLIADNFDDVNRALQPFRESLRSIFKTLKEGHSKKQNAEKELEKAQLELSSQFGIDDKPAGSSTPPTVFRTTEEKDAERDYNNRATAPSVTQSSDNEKGIFDRLKELSKSFSRS